MASPISRSPASGTASEIHRLVTSMLLGDNTPSQHVNLSPGAAPGSASFVNFVPTLGSSAQGHGTGQGDPARLERTQLVHVVQALTLHRTDAPQGQRRRRCRLRPACRPGSRLPLPMHSRPSQRGSSTQRQPCPRRSIAGRRRTSPRRLMLSSTLSCLLSRMPCSLVVKKGTAGCPACIRTIFSAPAKLQLHQALLNGRAIPPVLWQGGHRWEEQHLPMGRPQKVCGAETSRPLQVRRDIVRLAM